ncbi:MAG: hypothetical protein AAFV88_04395 [Planctomycetota bacterium]
MSGFPEDLPFRTPPDLSSREQIRFAFDRLGDRLDNAWDAIGILKNDAVSPASGGGIVANAANQISINVGAGLAIVSDQLVVGAVSPLTTQTGVLQILLGDGLETVNDLLTLDVGDGLSFKNGELIVAVGNGFDFDNGQLVPDFSGVPTAPNLLNRSVIFTDSSGDLSQLSASLLWGFGYGNAAGLTDNSYVYSNLPFGQYTTPSGAVTQSDWNTFHYPQINAIFLQIIEFIEDLQETVNDNYALLRSKGL